MRRQPINTYLTILALYDNGVLICSILLFNIPAVADYQRMESILSNNNYVNHIVNNTNHFHHNHENDTKTSKLISSKNQEKISQITDTMNVIHRTSRNLIDQTSSLKFRLFWNPETIGDKQYLPLKIMSNGFDIDCEEIIDNNHYHMKNNNLFSKRGKLENTRSRSNDLGDINGSINRMHYHHPPSSSTLNHNIRKAFGLEQQQQPINSETTTAENLNLSQLKQWNNFDCYILSCLNSLYQNNKTDSFDSRNMVDVSENFLSKIDLIDGSSRTEAIRKKFPSLSLSLDSMPSSSSIINQINLLKNRVEYLARCRDNLMKVLTLKQKFSSSSSSSKIDVPYSVYWSNAKVFYSKNSKTDFSVNITSERIESNMSQDSDVTSESFDLDQKSIPIWSPYPLVYYVKICYPAALFFQTGSIWATCLITIERYQAVCNPLVSLTLSTRSRAIWALTISSIMAFLFNIPRFFEVDTTDDIVRPTILRQNKIYYQVYYIFLNLNLNYLLPLTLVFTMNIKIYVNVRRAIKSRNELTRARQRELHLTTMLVAIVFIFIACNAPAFVVHCLEPYLSGKQNHFLDIVTIISNVLVCFNSAVNFVIYCIFGEKFRYKLWQVLGFRQRGRRQFLMSNFSSQRIHGTNDSVTNEGSINDPNGNTCMTLPLARSYNEDDDDINNNNKNFDRNRTVTIINHASKTRCKKYQHQTPKKYENRLKFDDQYPDSKTVMTNDKTNKVVIVDNQSNQNTLSKKFFKSLSHSDDDNYHNDHHHQNRHHYRYSKIFKSMELDEKEQTEKIDQNEIVTM